jgi:hypothetical protein
MVEKRKKKKKRKNIGKEREARTRILLLDTPNGQAEAEEAYDDDSDDGGMFLGKEDVQLIYNALREYKPTPDEELLHGIWLEEFEMMLVADYGEPYPDAN